MRNLRAGEVSCRNQILSNRRNIAVLHISFTFNRILRVSNRSEHVLRNFRVSVPRFRPLIGHQNRNHTHRVLFLHVKNLLMGCSDRRLRVPTNLLKIPRLPHLIATRSRSTVRGKKQSIEGNTSILHVRFNRAQTCNMVRGKSLDVMNFPIIHRESAIRYVRCRFTVLISTYRHTIDPLQSLSLALWVRNVERLRLIIFQRNHFTGTGGVRNSLLEVHRRYRSHSEGSKRGTWYLRPSLDNRAVSCLELLKLRISAGSGHRVRNIIQSSDVVRLTFELNLRLHNTVSLQTCLLSFTSRNNLLHRLNLRI